MPRSHHGLKFPATSTGFEQGAAGLREWLDGAGLAPGPRHNVELVFEEIITNIVRHGSPAEDIEVTMDRDEDEIVLTFDDNGVPFDLCERPDSLAPASIDEARLGGLGLVMIKKISTRLSYTRTPQSRNQLRLAIAAR